MDKESDPELVAAGMSELDLNGGKPNAGMDQSPHMAGPEMQKTRPRGGRTVDFPLRVLVSSDMVGAIIGRGGATIRNITQQSRARVDVHSYRKMEQHSQSQEKAITVYGQPENCTAACKRILEVMEEEAMNVGKPQEICLKILAHNNLIGRIIGKQGGTIKKIMEDTETRITVSSIENVNHFNPERVITIKGSIPNIARAESEVSSKLRAAYETDLAAMSPHSLMFPGLPPAAMMSTAGVSGSSGGHASGGGAGYRPGISASPGPRGHSSQQQTETTYLYIPNASVGAIIGTKGSHIRNIIKFSGSSVKIASNDDEESAGGDGGNQVTAAAAVAATAAAAGPDNLGPAAPQRKVTIVGAPEAQWKAQYLIFQKLREEGFANGREDVSLTVEILVPSSQVGRIIGKGGQNVREMQRVTGAVIKLPEQGTSSGEETSVHMIGAFYSIQSAQRRLRAMIQNPGPSISGATVAPLLPNGGSNPSLDINKQL